MPVVANRWRGRSGVSTLYEPAAGDPCHDGKAAAAGAGGAVTLRDRQFSLPMIVSSSASWGHAGPE